MKPWGKVAVVVLVGSGLLAPTAAGAESPTKVAVTAFFQAYQDSGLITRSASAITTVGVDGVSLTKSGGGVSTPDADARRALAVAHQNGLQAEILINNWDNSLGDFSTAAAHKLLSDPDKIWKVTSKIAGFVSSQGWDGVSVDLEALKRSDASGLVGFMHALQNHFVEPKTISICISNRTSVAGYRDGGYDLAGIAAVADRVMNMAYDQHGPWEKTPGPVGALTWQKAGVAAMEKKVPAGKIDLGQAGYGYIWNANGKARNVSDAKARELVEADGATAHFDNKTGEWLAKLSDGSTMWWADARSFQVRLFVARQLGIHGLAVWDLGQSDPLEQ